MKKKFFNLSVALAIVALVVLNVSVVFNGNAPSYLKMGVIGKVLAEASGAATTACSKTGTFYYNQKSKTEGNCYRNSMLCGHSNDCESAKSGDCTSHSCNP